MNDIDETEMLEMMFGFGSLVAYLNIWRLGKHSILGNCIKIMKYISLCVNIVHLVA